MKFENTKVFNFEGAFRGMRNPMDSWNKTDSFYCNEVTDEVFNCQDCYMYESLDDKCNCKFEENHYVLGENDLDLAQRLIKAGSEHAKFLRQVFVSVDITAPRFWWSEFDTYKIGTVANSCSTMHKLTAYPINRSMFDFDDIFDLTSKPKSPEELYLMQDVMIHINNTCDLLEQLRKMERETKDFKYKRVMKQILPEGFLQRRTVTLDYANIRSMVHQREFHKLIEWNDRFIKWVNTLPYAKELIIGK